MDRFWVDPKYKVSDLQRDNPSVGGPFSCLRYDYISNCSACELNHKGKRVGQHRERGCNANLKNRPELLARLKKQHEDPDSNTDSQRKRGRHSKGSDTEDDNDDSDYKLRARF